MGSVQTVRAESFPMSILSREGLRKSTADQNSMAPSIHCPIPETRAGKKIGVNSLTHIGRRAPGSADEGRSSSTFPPRPAW